MGKFNSLPHILAHDAFAEGSAPLVVESPGLSSFSPRDLGGWLRLRGDLTGEGPSSKVLIYVALKE